MPAPKGNQNAVGNQGGRPSKYTEDLPDLVEKLCKLGATDADIAEFLEIGLSTFSEWKVKYVELSDALKRGKLIADAEVASKLYHRATGYQHDDVDIRCYEGQIIKTDIVKHYPPDTTAGIFWLKNRQRGKWSDRIEHTGKGGKDLMPPADPLEIARRVAFLLAGAEAKKRSTN